jgi:arylsulfatase A-like enzyme
MTPTGTKDPAPAAGSVIPWLHFGSTVPLFLIFTLWAAVHSELGRHIAPGESPAFAWVRHHVGPGLGWVLAARLLIAAALEVQVRRSTGRPHPGRRPGVAAEIFCMAGVVWAAVFGAEAYLPWTASLYLVVVLGQGIGALLDGGFPMNLRQTASGVRFSRPAPWFFGGLFLLGGLTAVIEPSWRRMTDHVLLDSTLERLLHLALPAWIGGAVTLWVGIGLTIGIFLILAWKPRPADKGLLPALPLAAVFVFIPTLLSALLLAALMHAVTWEAAALNVKPAGIQLFLIGSVTGSAVLASVFIRLTRRWPEIRAFDPLSAMGLSLGAAVIWPLTALILSKRIRRGSRRHLAGAVASAGLAGIALVLFGNLFNPWYTAFSYLKGALVILLCFMTAGAVAMMLRPDGGPAPKGTLRGLRTGGLLLLAVLAGLGPFRMLDAYPEVKAVVLQYNELARVDAGLVRVAADAVGIGREIRLGQDPPPNGAPDPWPAPWRLRKTRASLLPADFNLLVIVVDALRGDAFTASGYRRDTTPFLDRWALSETVSFRRAYSQGGGTFAAIPFLVGGRSRFALYGPELYRRNLYLELARAEKIDQLWVTGRFGPRAIFPPDAPVKTLEIGRPVSDRHTPAADEAFDALGRAIDAQPPGERFLCFLYLMDVHNDLWKKSRGTDFGDRPRDIYDNNISYLDGACARFFDRLKSRGLYERTVILLTADHGEQFWEHGASLHGHTLYEEEIRVPWMMLTHGRVKRFDDVPVLNSDMAPTLVDLAGYAVDPAYADSHMGVSLRPLILDGEKASYLRRTVTGRASFKRRFLWYRDWEWKLVYSADLDVLQLFNVVRDPMERHNRLQEHPRLAAELESELMGYLKRVQGRTYRPVMSRPDR